MEMKSPAVFFDRDGTINPDPGYIRVPEDFTLFEETIPALRLLREHGYLLFVVTNQSGIGRGYFRHEDLAAVHRRMEELLQAGGITLDGIRYCPHHPSEDCGCRKPSPFMIQELARAHGVDLPRSWFVGDTPADVVSGRRAGCRTVRILGEGEDGREPSELPSPADIVVRSILDAARAIVRVDAS